ncbi:Uncharacterised protein [Vibrio cholerae]|nr:Uncharacterised protein [Vibrio cholerae]CSC45869.1 Uncharacterised protein [Vibrio cholerae]
MCGGIDDFHLLANHLAVGVDHFAQLGAKRLFDNRRIARFEQRLVHVKLIWVNRALYHHFT